MVFVKISKPLNQMKVEDMKMVKKDVRHVKFLFIIMDGIAPVVTYN